MAGMKFCFWWLVVVLTLVTIFVSPLPLALLLMCVASPWTWVIATPFVAAWIIWDQWQLHH